MCFNNPSIFSMIEEAMQNEAMQKAMQAEESKMEPEEDFAEESTTATIIDSRMGWICPLCGTVWSPLVESCDCQVDFLQHI